MLPMSMSVENDVGGHVGRHPPCATWQAKCGENTLYTMLNFLRRINLLTKGRLNGQWNCTMHITGDSKYFDRQDQREVDSHSRSLGCQQPDQILGMSTRKPEQTGCRSPDCQQLLTPNPTQQPAQ